AIFETIKDTAIIHKSGGGTGFSFSRLRAKNSPVRSTGGISSGPVSFMKVFNAATQAVKQGGTRRGANMGILRVDHPDILEFVACKENDKDITNFNISVAITEDFMKKVLAGEDYDLIDPRTKNTVQKLSAKKVFDTIIQMAWKNGEPGIIFIDRMNQYNPTPKLGLYESTNPCGEQVLLPYESCNLGSINLVKMVNNGKVDWDKISDTVEKSVHFLDNVIDMNVYPLKRIEEMTKGNRKIGLGVMGFADMLLMMGIRYDSEDAIALAEKVMKFILDAARGASEKLAEKKGAFPNFKGSIYDTPGARPLRNATLTTIAPTGTLSIIANSSSGIEPVFAITYIRNIMDNTKMIEAHPYFQEVAEKRGFFKPETMNLIAQKGTIRGVPEVPADVQQLFVTAHDIEAVWHIRMQSAFQKYTNNAVSKTVNLPSEATLEDVKTIYMLAFKSGCKGVTIYRDKSRDEQVLNIPSDNTKDRQKTQARVKISPRPRPPVILGTTTKIATGCGNLYITINEDADGQPFEVFMHMGKAGGCAMSQLEAIGRLLSLGLRSGIDVDSIVEQLRGIRCPSPSWEKGGRIFSCSDAIARAIEQRAQEAKNKKASNDTVSTSETTTETSQPDASGGSSKTGTMKKAGNIVGVCPDCGGALWHIEGCMVCKSCGYSKCG
ncbi:MAG: vitamin B12-dependent ribonucleotide reductase, partial [Candidatus Omnitrophica bacterium]|nr:vitamin B12-dependent ribonucleotide reductase [Candidatus Omnitrophota bacterium]